MARIQSNSSLPTGLSPDYWATWIASRPGASVSESVDRDVGEEWIGGWDGVGIYEGNNKIPSYQAVSVHLTNHRFIIIPDIPSTSSSTSSSTSISTPMSLQSHLSHVRQTEFYAGFMRSSAKITLSLGPQLVSQSQSQLQSESQSAAPNDLPHSDPSAAHRGNGGNAWTCNICGYVNSLSSGRSTPNPASKCGLCGIPYGNSQSSFSSSNNNSNLPSRSSTPSINLPSSLKNPNPSTINPLESDVKQEGNDGLISCPACTFLNSPLLPNCEICSTALPRKAKPPIKEGTTITPSPTTGKTDIVRLSFRRGGEKEVYKRLKAVLGDKAWERSGGVMMTTSKQGEIVEGLPRSGAGIDGILQQIDLNSKSQSDHISTAFADLEALMLRAGEMVRLAQSINTKLTTQQASNGIQPTEEESTMIRTSLVQLGLAAPAVTKEMIRDEKRYHDSLAKELGELLTGRYGIKGEGLMVGNKARGVIALDEIWGLWMRARGVSLLSPSTLISILPLIPLHTNPSINSLHLPSSLQVLHTPHYSAPSILSRSLDHLTPSSTSSSAEDTDETQGKEKSFTIFEFASIESLPIGLAKEFMEILEKQGGLVKDAQVGPSEGGEKWYRDIISSWPVANV
ncbi:uncharacterized protein IL334_003261 [Kwoniella shivajii]|uniref:Vacuolar protein-sorting-associated protein 36 n=1 Tax=Kwoniella shivajii TaxID=564305 RepID=A0ABZ1D016_9TREE|nr:hypothetical protein IL334_003261 [Kwoniella shivajii]